MNGELRVLEFHSEMSGLIASGESELTAYALALGSLIADVSSYYRVDPLATFDRFLAMAAEAAADDQIVAWLRSQMIEPTL